MRPNLVVVTAFFWAALFGTTLVSCQSETPSVPVSVDSCVANWWVQSASSPWTMCQAIPECAQSDCVQLGFEGFKPGNIEYNGIVMYSREASSMSSVGDAVKRTYSVVDGKIHIDGTPASGQMSCASDRLNGSYSYQVRAPQDLANGLDRTVASGNLDFRGLSLAK